LHLVPAGIFYEDKICVLGNGMVIDPKALLSEIDYLNGYDVSTDRLKVSNRAHVILPYHILLDSLQEGEKGDLKIGTTGRGIGPAYMNKSFRDGIRIADLLDRDLFYEKLERNLKEKNRLFKQVYNVEPLDIEDIFEEYYEYGQQIAKYVCDTSLVLND